MDISLTSGDREGKSISYVMDGWYGYSLTSGDREGKSISYVMDGWYVYFTDQWR